MKRILVLLFVLLLLAGCSTEPGNTTTIPATTTVPASSAETTVATEPDPGLYWPESEVEIATNGAVRAYLMENSLSLDLAFMGEDILICSYEGGEQVTTVLTLLRGENCSVVKTVKLASENYLVDGSIQVSDQGVCYYDRSAGSVVFLDTLLRETRRVALPEAAKENPMISPDMSTVYYCVGTEIRAFDLNTGIARLLKQNSCLWQKVNQVLFDGSVIACEVLESEKVSYTAYISTENGRTLATDDGVWMIDTWQDRYYLQRFDGSVLERLFGNRDGEVKSLNLPKDVVGNYNIYSILSMNGLVTYQEKTAERDALLSYYDLSAGKRISVVQVPGVTSVYAMKPDPAGECIWFMLFDAEQDRDVLCCWDLAATSVEDSLVYTGTRYTAQYPDAEGQARCQQLADAINAQYGVKFVLWDAVQKPEDYVLTFEHQVPPVEDALERLAECLAVFPEGFLERMSIVSQNGEIQIGLVREISHDSVGAQYWINGNAYIALAIDENIEQNFYHEFFHVLDSFVIANSRSYDLWDDMNPSKFSYDYNYTDYLSRTDTTYLTGAKRAFIDSYSMSYPKEDRARLFEYAMLANAGSEFQSDILQKKLHTLCYGIREAFGWKKDEREFPWEQHLEKSLAYKKKS